MKLSTRLAGIFYTCILLLLSIRIAAAQENPPLLKNIHAEAISETEIAITWTMPSPLPSGNNAVKQIWLYRDTQPIALRSRIEALVPIAKLAADTTSYTDVISDYREYYYAITAVTADDFQYNLILPAINATASGVRVLRRIATDTTAPDKIELPVIDGIRGTPLPYLDLLPAQERMPSQFSNEILAAAESLSETDYKKSPKIMKTYIFSEEQTEGASGDDYLLRKIMEETFLRGDYEAAVSKFTEFLNLNRSKNTTARACFYIAESLYFMKDYRNALTYFLQIEDIFPDIVSKWIYSSLSLYTLPPEQKETL